MEDMLVIRYKVGRWIAILEYHSVDGNSTISTSTFDTTRGHTHDTSMVEDSETNIGIIPSNHRTKEQLEVQHTREEEQGSPLFLYTPRELF